MPRAAPATLTAPPPDRSRPWDPGRRLSSPVIHSSRNTSVDRDEVPVGAQPDLLHDRSSLGDDSSEDEGPRALPVLQDPTAPRPVDSRDTAIQNHWRRFALAKYVRANHYRISWEPGSPTEVPPCKFPFVPPPDPASNPWIAGVDSLLDRHELQTRINEALLSITTDYRGLLIQRRQALLLHAMTFLHSTLPLTSIFESSVPPFSSHLSSYGTRSGSDLVWWRRFSALPPPATLGFLPVDRAGLLRNRADAALSALSRHYRTGGALPSAHAWLLDDGFSSLFPSLAWLRDVPTSKGGSPPLLTLAALQVSGSLGTSDDVRLHADFTLPAVWHRGSATLVSSGTVDTGAMLSIMSSAECARLGFQLLPGSSCGFDVVDAQNKSLPIRGTVSGPATLHLLSDDGVEVPFLFAGTNVRTSIFVVDSLPCPLLLGLPILQEHDAVLRTRSLSMTLGSHHFSPRSGTCAPATLAAAIRSDDNLARDKVHLVYAVADVELLPGYAHRVPLDLAAGGLAPRYFVGDSAYEDTKGYRAVDGLLDDGITPCIILQNLTVAPLLLRSSHPLGTVCELHQRRVFVIATADATVDSSAASFDTRDHPRAPPLDPDPDILAPFDTASPFDGPSIIEIAPQDIPKAVTPEGLRAMLSPDIPPEWTDKFLALLWQHRDVWTNSFSAQWDCGEFVIRLNPDASPYKARSFRFPHAQLEPLRDLIAKWLDEGVIEPSNSPWCSSAFFVPKPHGGGLRFVVDYRVLNANTIADRFPLPEIQDVFTNFRGHEVFSTFDALSGFNQQSVHPDSRDLTSFVCPLGTFRSTRLSMGLRNGPASFQRGMMLMCNGLFGVNVYVDDVSISNGPEPPTPDPAAAASPQPLGVWEIHLQRVAAFLDRCTNHQLRLNPRKCIIGARSVKYLGYIISKEGLKPDPEKVAALDSIDAPRDPHDVRVFLGLINYYRSFIPDCARLSLPLNALLVKGEPWRWTSVHQASFEALRASLSAECLRSHYDPTVPLELYTDCSDFAMGAVLSQKIDGEDRVIAFFSRSLKAAERNYSVYQKECLAIVSSIVYFHQYLAGIHFTVYTDHYSLASVLRWKDPPQRIARWIQILDGYHFTARYKAGSSHANADALSRLESRYVRKVLPGSLDYFPHEDLLGVTTIPRLNDMLDGILPPLPDVIATTPLGPIRVGCVNYRSVLAPLDATQQEYAYLYGESRKILAARKRSSSPETIQGPIPQEVLDDIDSSNMPFDTVFQFLGRRFVDPDDDVEYTIEDIYLNEQEQAFVVERSPFDRTLVATEASKEPIYFDTVLVYLQGQPPRTHPDRDRQAFIDDNDAFCASVRDCITRWTAESKLRPNDILAVPDEDGFVHMYRRSRHSPSETDRLQFILPDCPRGLLMRQHMLYSCHEATGHLHTDKFLADLQQRVWWPGMYVEAKAHAQSCDICQARGTTRDRASSGIPTQTHPRVYRPFDRIAVDVLGPMSSKQSGKQYVIVAIDHFTRWVEAEAYDTVPTAEDVNQFMVRHFYFRHGAPRAILADNGSNLTANKLNSYLFQALGSRVRNVTAYHPQANGMVERVNKPICDILSTFCTDGNGSDWAQHLDAVIHVLNTSVHSVTGYTPFFLVHGREANRVIDHRLPRAWDVRFQNRSWTEYAVGLLRTLEVAGILASQRIDRAHSLYNAPKVFHDTVATDRPVQPRSAAKYLKPFQAGDWVLLFTPVMASSVKHLQVKKLARFWRGPFQILKAVSDTVYLVLVNSNEIPVHLSRLKRYHARSPLSRAPF